MSIVNGSRILPTVMGSPTRASDRKRKPNSRYEDFIMSNDGGVHGLAVGGSNQEVGSKNQSSNREREFSSVDFSVVYEEESGKEPVRDPSARFELDTVPTRSDKEVGINQQVVFTNSGPSTKESENFPDYVEINQVSKDIVKQP